MKVDQFIKNEYSIINFDNIVDVVNPKDNWGARKFFRYSRLLQE